MPSRAGGQSKLTRSRTLAHGHFAGSTSALCGADIPCPKTKNCKTNLSLFEVSKTVEQSSPERPSTPVRRTPKTLAARLVLHSSHSKAGTDRRESFRAPFRDAACHGMPVGLDSSNRAVLGALSSDEIKDDLSRYLRLAKNEEIVITKHGKPAGILVGFASDDDCFDYKLEHDPRFLRRIARAGEPAGREGTEARGPANVSQKRAADEPLNSF
jgi:prevent-host-death family protein